LARKRPWLKQGMTTLTEGWGIFIVTGRTIPPRVQATEELRHRT
jgi:hypothetical protein